MFGALTSAFCIMFISLVGALFFREEKSAIHVHSFVLPIAVGVFLGVVFFDLVPETLASSPQWGPIAIVGGFLGFYLLSHFLDTYHHHTDSHNECSHTSGQMILIGSAIHNLADGIVIMSAFLLNPVAGVMTAVGIALHEVPQKIATFGILLQSGYSRYKASLFSVLSASSVVWGVVLTYFFMHSFAGFVFILTGVAAGNLLYIATTDLIPELRHSHRHHFIQTFIATLAGVLVIGGLITYTHSIF